MNAKRTVVAVLLAAWAALVGPAGLASAASVEHGHWEASAWTFGARGSVQSAQAAGAIDEVQADWYVAHPDGSLTTTSVDPALVALAQGSGCRVMATVTNWSGGFDLDLENVPAEDYARLGTAVDEFRVMTCSYHGAWGGPGPIAPPGWMDRVMDLAVTQIEPAKVWLGVPFYGCDWWRRS